MPFAFSAGVLMLTLINKFLSRRLNVVRQILSFGAIDGTARAINWATMAVLPLLLASSEQYGQVGLLVSIELLVANVSRMGQDRAILRFCAKSGRASSFLKSALVIVAAMAWLPIAGTVALLLSGVKQFFGVPVFPHLFLLSISLAFYNLNLLCVNVNRVRYHLAGFARFRLSYVGLKFVLVLLMAAMVGSSMSYALGVLLAGFIVVILAVPFLSREISGRPEKTAVFQSFLFGWPFVFHVVSGNVMDYVNRFFLQAYGTLQEVGLFTFAFTIGNGLFMFYAVLATYFEPRIYSHADNQRRSEQWLFYYTTLCVILSSAAGAVLVLITPLLLSRMPPAYVSTGPIILIILGAKLLKPLYIQGNYRLMVYKKTHHIATCTFLSAVLNTVLNVLLIPRYGMWGAAITMFITNFFLSFYIMTVSLRVGRVPWLNKFNLSIIGLCVAGSFFTLLANKPMITLAGLSVVCLASCGLLLNSFLTRGKQPVWQQQQQ